MVTPRMEKGYELLDTDDQTQRTAIIVPLNLTGKRMKATMQLIVEAPGEDVDLAKHMIYTAPQPTFDSPYWIRPSIYVVAEDKLITFDRFLTLDGFLSCIALFDEDDVVLRWENW